MAELTLQSINLHWTMNGGSRSRILEMRLNKHVKQGVILNNTNVPGCCLVRKGMSRPARRVQQRLLWSSELVREFSRSVPIEWHVSGEKKIAKKCVFQQNLKQGYWILVMLKLGVGLISAVSLWEQLAAVLPVIAEYSTCHVTVHGEPLACPSGLRHLQNH